MQDLKGNLRAPKVLKTVKLLLGVTSEVKMRHIYLSYNTIDRCIADMSKDLKEQWQVKLIHLMCFYSPVGQSEDVI